jgi:hypothetical protein
MQASAHSPRANPSSAGRATAAGARDIALRDEHVFPALRLRAIAGETSLENILRQIDALQAPAAPAAPTPDRPQQRDAKQGPEPPASPAQPKPRRKQDLGKAFALRKAGVGLVAGVALAGATLYPTNAHFLTSWVASPLDVEAAPAAFRPAAPATEASPLADTSSHPGASTQPSTMPSTAVEVTPLAPPAPPTGSGVSIVAMPPPLPGAAAAAPQLAARLTPPPAVVGDTPPGSEQAKPDAAPLPSAATPALQTAALSPAPAQPVSATPAAAPARNHAPSSAPPVSAQNTGSTEPAPEPRADSGNTPVDVLLERGNRLLASGDIVSARQFFERAQAAGVPTAASRIAATYDPLFLRQIGAVGVKADTAQAVAWYRQAANAGDAEAAESLKRLLNGSSATASRMAGSP